jgi:hypothetical protein
MIHNYVNWINENKNTDLKRRFADIFLNKLKKELKQYSNFTQEFGKFEDWWSVSERDYKDEDPAYLDGLERIQRRTPEDQRFRGDIYFLEFHVKINQQTSAWKLCTLNLTNFTIKIHEDLHSPIRSASGVTINPLGERVQQLFDETIKEMNLTGTSHGNQYGI